MLKFKQMKCINLSLNTEFNTNAAQFKQTK